MRSVVSRGQHPDQVVAACVRMARRAMARPATRLVTMEALKPFTRATGHGDLNGDTIPAALYKWAERVTYYREPSSDPRFAGEIVHAPAITVAVNGGDCDDIATAVATMARTLGLEAMIGQVTNPGGASAHVVAAVRGGWYEPGSWWVVDPQRPGGPAPVDAFPGARWAEV